MDTGFTKVQTISESCPKSFSVENELEWVHGPFRKSNMSDKNWETSEHLFCFLGWLSSETAWRHTQAQIVAATLLPCLARTEVWCSIFRIKLLCLVMRESIFPNVCKCYNWRGYFSNRTASGITYIYMATQHNDFHDGDIMKLLGRSKIS